MDFKVYEIPNNVKTGIYLLIDDDEIVYVGQTKNGLRRIMQHYDKIFNKYAFIETIKDDLDYYEDLYIMKYQPKYNNFYNCYRISIDSSYNKLKYALKKIINIKQYEEYILKKNIKIKNFKKYKTITKEESIYINQLLEKECDL